MSASSPSESGRLFEKSLDIFLSVDLVGSTRLKSLQKLRTPSEISPTIGWPETLKSFFSVFPENVRVACLERHLDPLCIWKGLGDEIIFRTSLKKASDADLYVRAFKDAAKNFRKTIRAWHPWMDVKACGWTAGFPVRNRRISISVDGTAVLDFFGPSMDAGFRLAKFATPRKFVLSIELAALLGAAGDPVHMQVDAAESLKGLLGDRPYPIIWSDLFPYPIDDHIDAFCHRKNPLAATEAQTLCKAFAAEFPETVSYPFIENDPDFNIKPEGYDKDYDSLRALAIKLGEMSEGADLDAPGRPAPEAEIEKITERIPSPPSAS